MTIIWLYRLLRQWFTSIVFGWISYLHTCLQVPSDRSVGVQHPGAGTLCWLTHPGCPSVPAGWPELMPTENEHLERRQQVKLSSQQQQIGKKRFTVVVRKYVAKTHDVLKKKKWILFPNIMPKNTPVLVDVLTSTQGSLWIKYVPAKCDSLGHHMLVKSYFFGIVQGVAHHRGAKDIFHRLPQVRFIAHQGQSCVDIVLSNLRGGKRQNNKLKEEEKNMFYFTMWLNTVFSKKDNSLFSHQTLGRVHYFVIKNSRRNLV